MPKPRNPDRIDLHLKVIKLANLPEGKKALGYFTRDQIVELVAYLEHVNALVTEVNRGRS
jgi:hypothetical protein